MPGLYRSNEYCRRFEWKRVMNLLDSCYLANVLAYFDKTVYINSGCHSTVSSDHILESIFFTAFVLMQQKNIQMEFQNRDYILDVKDCFRIIFDVLLVLDVLMASIPTVICAIDISGITRAKNIWLYIGQNWTNILCLFKRSNLR